MTWFIKPWSVRSLKNTNFLIIIFFFQIAIESQRYAPIYFIIFFFYNIVYLKDRKLDFFFSTLYTDFVRWNADLGRSQSCSNHDTWAHNIIVQSILRNDTVAVNVIIMYVVLSYIHYGYRLRRKTGFFFFLTFSS